MPVPPSIKLSSFDCPHCGAFAQQHWHMGYARRIPPGEPPKLAALEAFRAFVASTKSLNNLVSPGSSQQTALSAPAPQEAQVTAIKLIGPVDLPHSARDDWLVNNLCISMCHSCKDVAIWKADSLIYPAASTVPLPNSDMPENVKADYLEARLILAASPKGAAALLRLALQKLCVHLGKSGKNLNSDIAALVADGKLPISVQKALDAVRVVGNNLVHPGEITAEDTPEVAHTLFRIMNFIVERTISDPKAVDAFFDKNVPSAQKEQIEKRDAKTK